MVELLMKLDKQTLAALCIALFRVHQEWNAKSIVKSILKDFEDEKHSSDN